MLADRAGNFFAEWLGRTIPQVSSAVVVRKLDAGGHPLGPEIEVDRTDYGYSSPPRIAAAPDGRTVVVWSRMYDVVRARFLTSDGQPAGAAFPVADADDCCHVFPDVAFLSSGDFVVIWHQKASDGVEPWFFSDHVLARTFDPAGHPRGDAFELTEGAGREPSRVAADPTGGFAIAYEVDFVPDSIRFRRFNADGSPRADEVTADDHLAFGPVPVFSPQGELTIVWGHASSLLYVDPAGIFARRFAADGSPLGPKFQLAAGALAGARPDLADDHQGHRLLVWPAF